MNIATSMDRVFERHGKELWHKQHCIPIYIKVLVVIVVVAETSEERRKRREE
jgi:hypothetical protein